MSQSAFLVGMLGLGFILFLAAKGRLPAYTAVLWGPTSQPEQDNKSSSSGSEGFNVSDAAKVVTDVLPYIIG